MCDILRERSKTLLELIAGAKRIVQKPQIYDEKAVAKFINAQNLGYLSEFSQNLSTQKSAAEFESAMNEFLNARNLELKHIAQALRIALTGSSVSPGIYEVLEFLGANECKERIASFLSAMKGK